MAATKREMDFFNLGRALGLAEGGWGSDAEDFARRRLPRHVMARIDEWVKDGKYEVDSRYCMVEPLKDEAQLWGLKDGLELEE